MKWAFILYRYFPYGGLQQDFLAIAAAAVARGHRVHVYTLEWEGEIPANIDVNVVPVRHGRNHRRYQSFHLALQPLIASGNYDCVVGFNKMPGLDVYFAADPCFEEKSRQLRRWYYRYSARYRHFSAFERAVFDPGARTELLMISKIEMRHFQRHYDTPEERFQLLPPGIARDRTRPRHSETVRQAVRTELSLPADARLALMIASDFRRKGVDRAIRALAALHADRFRQTHLIVIGQDDPKRDRRLATHLSVSDRVHFLAGRLDVPRFLASSDFFVHPAHSEAAGKAILEAVVFGLPVLVTANCGYAYHVERAGAGIVLPQPFDQSAFNAAFRRMHDPSECQSWQENAIRYAASVDLYSQPEAACKIIEQASCHMLQAATN